MPRPVRFWPPNGSFYRPVYNLDSLWMSDPPISGDYEWDPMLIHGETKEWDELPPAQIRAPKRRCHAWFWQYFGSIFRRDDNASEDDLIARFGPKPTAADFKAYGQWARPWVNGVCVDNRGPGRRLRSAAEVVLYQVFDRLVGPYGSPHPEAWIPGVQHPSLPPRPPFWRTPHPGEPLPFPWECELNFFMKHRSVGLHPLLFDIGRETTGIIFSLPQDQTIPAWQADMAQPATWPFLTHMPICAVADESSPTFPWPFTVVNPDGISCGDIFDAIFVNFNQLVSQPEYEKWSPRRRDNASRAYYERIRNSQARDEQVRHLDVEIGGHDGLRRIDYMGDRVMFRGLEPSPEKDGTWILFTGPP